MPVIQVSYPDLGIWVLHLSVLHQHLAPNLEQTLYSQWVRDSSQHSQWMDKPSLLKQCCYIGKASSGRKKSCEMLWGLFPFMARLCCVRFFLLMLACKKKWHGKEIIAFFKCQQKNNPSERTVTQMCFVLFCFFLMWKRNVNIYLFISLEEPVWVTKSALICRNLKVTSF